MRFYNTPEERDAAVAAGETTLADSTLLDGRPHYAIFRYCKGDMAEVAINLTGSPHDDAVSAAELAAIRDRATRGPGVIGYGAERIA